MGTIDRVRVSVDVAGTPDQVFDVIADPRRHVEFDGSGTIRECAEVPPRMEVGSVFVMRMRLNGTSYRSKNEVVEFEPGRVVAWRTTPHGRLLGIFFGGQIWRFEVEPSEPGCTVTHSWDASRLLRSPIPTRLMRFEDRNRAGMQASLEKLQAAFA